MYKYKIKLFTLSECNGASPWCTAVVFQRSTEDSNQVEESHGALRLVLRAVPITSNHFSLKNVLRQLFVSRACRSENNNAHGVHTFGR